jgi:hypothetical protein
MPVVGSHRPNSLAAVGVPGGQVGQGTAPLVGVLDPHRASQPSWQGRVAAAAGLDGGLLIRAQHEVALAEWLAVVASGVPVQHDGGAGGEVRCPWGDPRSVLPRFERIGAQPATHGGAADGIDQSGGDRLVGHLGGAPPRQRHPAGRGQLADQGLDLGLLHRGEPGRATAAFSVAQPVEGVGGEPAPPLACGVGSDPTPAGDRGVGVPGGGIQHDQCPQPVPVRALVTPGDLVQAVPLRGGQPHRVCAWGGHRPSIDARQCDDR